MYEISSRQLSATHFCDSPNTPAQYVPCGWEGKAFIQLLQGCHQDCLINHLVGITQVGLNPKPTEINRKLPTDFTQLWTRTSGLYRTTVLGTGLPLPLRSRIKLWLCHRAVRDVAHSITQMATRVLFSLTLLLINTNHVKNIYQTHTVNMAIICPRFPSLCLERLVPPWGTRAARSLAAWAHAINLTAWEKAGRSPICLPLATCPLDRSALLLQAFL